jgi:hypothetical protein
MQIYSNKTLKLTNVLVKAVPQEGLGKVGLLIEQQGNFMQDTAPEQAVMPDMPPDENEVTY